MIVFETVDLIFDKIGWFIASLLFSIVFSFTLSFIFTRKIISGLVFAQIAFVFNMAVVLFLVFVGSLGNMRFLHFLFIELFVMFCMYSVYRSILGNKAVIMEKIGAFPIQRVSCLIILFAISLVILNFYLVPEGGGSRIQYQTNRWYSYLRIPKSIIVPLGFFLAIYFLDHKKYAISFLLTASLILLSASAGSKAGFLLSIIGAYYFYRDLKGEKIRINPLVFVVSIGSLLVSVILVLNRLNVSASDIFIRLVHNAEATIMVYADSNPTNACESLSLFASIHRGVARLFNDASAMNIDTLFGFALTLVHYGANTFTGPNSSIPAYILCNFPGFLVLVGLSIIVLYTLILKKFQMLSIYHTSKVSVLLIPFIVVSINAFPQDYYTGMSDLTTIVIITLVLLMLEIVIMSLLQKGQRKFVAH